MPSSFVAPRAVASVLLPLLLAMPAAVLALCCDQPTAVMNGYLVCPRALTKCTIEAAQTIDPPTATCPILGCELDFGARPVTFNNTLKIAAGKLTVWAKSITVAGAIDAVPPRQDVAVEMIATGDDCGAGAGAGDVVVRSGIDISGAAPRTIRLVAGCGVALESTGALTASSNGGNGGVIEILAGTAIVQAGPLRATASGNFGGDVRMNAGDDLQVQRTIDVRSQGDGEGGTISLRAGDPVLAGVAPGGTLTIAADLIADGSADSDGTTGEDGGSIALDAAGAIILAGSAAIRANGGSPDGAGGSVTIGSQQPPAGVLTALDGDVTLAGPISVRGASIGDGGDVEIAAGRDFWLQQPLDLTGGGDDASAGTLAITAGGNLRLDGTIAVNGRVATSSGGSVDMTAGLATANATLTAAKQIDVSAGAESEAGEVNLAACRLTVSPNVLFDARSSLASRGPVITLAAPDVLSLGAGSRFLAPSGPVSNRILQAPATNVSIGSGVVFSPPVTTSVIPVERTPMPPCPVCGDGVRQGGEPCDFGVGADGACCSADCLHLLCPTPTPTATATVLATGPTLTPTPSPTRTPTLTPTPTITVTPGLPPLQPRSALLCERALAKGSSRLVTNELTFLESCSLEALACLALGDVERTPCLTRATRRCTSRFTKLVRVRRTFAAAFAKACSDPIGLPFALLRAPAVLAFANLEATCQDDVGLALTSPSAVLACVEAGTCAGERALATALPRLAELMPQVFDGSSAGFCLVPATPDPGNPPGTLSSRGALRCQRAIVTASRKLLARDLDVAHRCVDSLLACRLQGGDAASCAPLADRCARKLAALTDTTAGARARLASAVVRGCGGLSPSSLLAEDGLGFGSIANACADLDTAVPQTAADLAPCIGAAYGCAAGAVVRRALPLVDDELARVGMTLGNDFACPGPRPSPTSTPQPGETTTATPTVVPTASVTPTPVTPATLLIAGGGSAASDCVTEWTVRGAVVDPPSLTTCGCTDGDPTCDADGAMNDVCVFALGICLGGTDPRLADCPAADDISSFALQSPQPGSSNAIDAANALALLTAISDLVGTAPGGAGSNTFTFAPPLVLTPPNHCTATAAVAVERRNLDRRTERFRARAVAAVSGGTVADDRDSLYLTCIRPGS